MTEHSALDDVMKQLGIQDSRPVLVLTGWAGEAPKAQTDIWDRVTVMMRDVIGPTCQHSGAVVVTGGTDCGVMAGIAQASIALGLNLKMIGVAPLALLRGVEGGGTEAEATTPEPHHHIVTTPGTKFTDERPYLIAIAERIAGTRGLCLAALGGGKGTAKEIAFAAERGWPTILFTALDGASNTIARRAAAPSLGSPAEHHLEPAAADYAAASQLSEEGKDDPWSSLPPGQQRVILRRAASSRIVSCPLDDRLQADRALRWVLSGDYLLKSAWEAYTAADSAAIREKRPTRYLSTAVAVAAALTVVTGILANAPLGSSPFGFFEIQQTFRYWCKVASTALPLSAIALLGLLDRRRSASPWIELRAAAERTVQEIYRYRSRLLIPDVSGRAPLALADSLSVIDMAVKGRLGALTSPSKSWPWPWPPSPLMTSSTFDGDPLMSPLSSRTYDRARVGRQLAYYAMTCLKNGRRSTAVAAVVFGLAAITALMLSMSWVGAGTPSSPPSTEPPFASYAAVAGALAAAFIAWRVHDQIDSTTESYYTASAGLRAARSRWLSRIAVSESPEAELGAYVEEAESALSAEGSIWATALSQAQQAFLDQMSSTK